MSQTEINRRRIIGSGSNIPIPNYLKFTALEDNSSVKLTIPNTVTDVNYQYVEYSRNGKTWTKIDNDNTQKVIDVTLNKDDYVLFRGQGNTMATGSYTRSTFSMTGKIASSGNVMSLLNGDEFDSITTISTPYCFAGLFIVCTSLITAPELPATTLANYCYQSMFEGCTSLTTAPELPATTLADSCYMSMFKGCTSLTTVPALRATTLADSCCFFMFQDCTSLITAPELPATTLTSSCYMSMFQGCTSLITAPELPATTLASDCYQSMFQGCTSLTTAPELPATTLATRCYKDMFIYCTSLINAPALPATTLAEGCYREMFYRCSQLNHITMLAINISASRCLEDWVSGVSATGTFVKNPAMTSLPTGSSGIPNGWTVEDYPN